MYDEPTDAKRAYREMHILRHLFHPAIVNLSDIICPALNVLQASALKTDTTPTKLQRTSPLIGSDRKAMPATLPEHNDMPKFTLEQFGTLYLVFEFVDTDL
jgi:serine/threonine protein kinase